MARRKRGGRGGQAPTSIDTDMTAPHGRMMKKRGGKKRGGKRRR